MNRPEAVPAAPLLGADLRSALHLPPALAGRGHQHPALPPLLSAPFQLSTCRHHELADPDLHGQAPRGDVGGRRLYLPDWKRAWARPQYAIQSVMMNRGVLRLCTSLLYRHLSAFRRAYNRGAVLPGAICSISMR